MKELFGYVMDIGEQMLVCGAEVHRAEDSISRMCMAIGFQRSDVFIITNSMVVTVYTSDGGSLTQTRRIKGTGTDLERLHLLNSLSRQICTQSMTAEEVRDRYSEILACHPYPFWLEWIGCAIIAGSYTLFFGGSPVDAPVSMVIGAIIRLTMFGTERLQMNKIFERFICSFVATVLAFSAVKLLPMCHVDKLIIGNIMVLIPGIGLTNALRDLLIGDSMAGLLRAIEAVLIALAMAAGYFLSAMLFGGL